MSLAEIVADVATKHEKAGIVDRNAAVNEALPRVMAEPFTVEHIVRRHLSNSIKQHLTKVRDAAVNTFGSKQGSLFELRPAHVLDGDDGVLQVWCDGVERHVASGRRRALGPRHHGGVPRWPASQAS